MSKILCQYLIYLNEYNNNAQLFFYYANILDETGKTRNDYLESEKYFLKSLNIDNKLDHTHNCYAILLKNKLFNYNKAMFHYKKAIEINPNNSIYYYNFANILKNIGNTMNDYLESELYYLQSIEINNNFSKAHANYSLLLQNKLLDYDKAEIHWKKALYIDPNDAINNCNYGYFLAFHKNNLQQGLIYLNKSIILNNQLTKAYYNKGVLLYKLKEYNKCKQALERCLVLHNSNNIDDKLTNHQIQHINEINNHNNNNTLLLFETGRNPKLFELFLNCIFHFATRMLGLNQFGSTFLQKYLNFGVKDGNTIKNTLFVCVFSFVSFYIFVYLL